MSEASAGSVTKMIKDLKAGDPSAFGPLWDRYFSAAVRLARAGLLAASAPRTAADEEDLASSALESLWRRIKKGQFAELENREDLWRLLFVITVRKVSNHLRHCQAKRRGGGHVVLEADLPADADEDAVLNQIGGREPSPELGAIFADWFEWLLSRLDDDLRSIALWRLEGITVEEIGEKLGCCPRTVDFKLALIRRTWEEATEDERGSAD